MPFMPTSDTRAGSPLLTVVQDPGSLLMLTAMYTCSPLAISSPVNCDEIPSQHRHIWSHRLKPYIDVDIVGEISHGSLSWGRMC